ncbi:SCO family protein [Pseudomonas sp. 14P_8.1_Bac3]|uniref:SCO family protein n=1 Tax=Pseudomonas sp. 14P_8.1_Bac3 TaxID=2971621 RepID=UPI0021C95F66|nr:SCO family protein [Pseudomonas sp. 14P_8.1_Bac3]MCU1758503.1 SCO family protein [Pseudomonas sp. 14P_8.1_Bac3]
MKWLATLLLMGLATQPMAAARTDIGGPFQLTNQNGQRVTERSFGEPALLYFGFMTCPAICPTDLAKMARISRQLQQQQGIKVRPIFVTIDPERDTPARLKTYVNYFASDFVGLTGSPQEIARITDAYHVYYKKVPSGDGQYMMDHSTILFLLDSQGRYLKHFGRGLDEKEIEQQVVTALADAAAGR